MTSPAARDASPTIRNPARLWVPLITFACVVVMFLPPIVIGFRQTGLTLVSGLGTLVFLGSAAWLLRSAWRAPMALSIDGDALLISRPKRVDRLAAADVKRWTFSLPQGLPTREPPATNALLIVVFREGTTFRGEVTSEESRAFASWFDRHLSPDA